jgi:hypothetical protein
MKTDIHFWSYLLQVFLEWETLQTKFVWKINTQIGFIKVFFSSFRLWDNVEKYCKSWQATDDSMAQAHYMLDY